MGEPDAFCTGELGAPAERLEQLAGAVHRAHAARSGDESQDVGRRKNKHKNKAAKQTRRLLVI